MWYAVTRKCCLGPNCANGHGAPTYDPTTNKTIDKRLTVVQWASKSKTACDRVAQNWKQYEAQTVEVTVALFGTLHPKSAAWLQERINTSKEPDDQDLPDQPPPPPLKIAHARDLCDALTTAIATQKQYEKDTGNNAYSTYVYKLEEILEELKAGRNIKIEIPEDWVY